MVLHNDYGFQFLLSDNDQGVKKKMWKCLESLPLFHIREWR